jgi:twitching motility two-component system response regulator PilG
MACRRNPEMEQAWLWRSSLATDSTESIECLRQVLRINPDNRIAQQWLTRYESQVHEAEQYECPFCGREDPRDFYRCPACKAVVTLDLDLFTDSPDNINQNVIEKAIVYYQSAKDVEPYNANHWLGIAYLNLHKSENALAHLVEAFKLRPQNTELASQIEKLQKRKLVLVVDDSATIRSLVTRLLERNNCRTVEAASGMEALSRLEEKDVSAVILDIGMPLIDGYKVCKMIRSHYKTACVPVIMLSGNDGFFDKVRGKLAGATDYLTKPLKPHLLLSAIHKYLASQ